MRKGLVTEFNAELVVVEMSADGSEPLIQFVVEPSTNKDSITTGGGTELVVTLAGSTTARPFTVGNQSLPSSVLQAPG